MSVFRLEDHHEAATEARELIDLWPGLAIDPTAVVSVIVNPSNKRLGVPDHVGVNFRDGGQRTWPCDSEEQAMERHSEVAAKINAILKAKGGTP